MSTSKKPLRKRKRQSPSHIGRRLEKLRYGQRNLWDDDNDDDNDDGNTNEENIPTKTKPTTEQTYIVLTDSDEEKSSSRTRTKSSKSRKKLLKSLDENVSSDNECKATTTAASSKCPTCLICSILTTLTSYNCCANHLDLLVHKKISHQQHSKPDTSREQWPPQQVMIVPMTDELLQRYFNSQDIYQLKPKNSPATTNKKSIRKATKKTTSTTSEISDIEPASTKPTQTSPEAPADSSLPNSGAAPSDATFTVITSTSTTLNSFESPTMLDTCQLQQSSDQPIVIDDSQSDISTATTKNKQKDPWVPISDETYEAIENALSEQIVFPPAIARRTPTELMASRLPKIQLKQGRYRYGKPVAEKIPVDTTKTTTTTTTTTTNESRSNDTSQSATISSSTSTSVMNTNTRPVSSLATIIEDESLVIQSTRPLMDKNPQTNNLPLPPPSSSERQDNTPEGLSDTVMSCLFAQDELSQQDNVQLVAKSVSNEVVDLPPPPVVNRVEEPVPESTSQSSQLTNDQIDTQPVISSTTITEKINTTPSRISYRRNPDGSLVSISRPRLSTNQQTPTSALRRKSTDVTPGPSQAK